MADAVEKTVEVTEEDSEEANLLRVSMAEVFCGGGGGGSALTCAICCAT